MPRRLQHSQGVPIVQDDDQDTTDLMKCVSALEKKEIDEGQGVRDRGHFIVEAADAVLNLNDMQQYDVILLGGLSGRLDQTVHTLSYLQKLRKIRERVFAITDENIGWVLQEVCVFLLIMRYPLLRPCVG